MIRLQALNPGAIILAISKRLYSVAGVILMALPLSSANAGDIVVIVNPSTQVTTLDKDHVMRIFLLKAKTFPNEATAVPFNAPENSALRKTFDLTVFEKQPDQIKAYWTRLLFTGRGRPPPSIENDAEMVKRVAATPGAVGYVDSTAVNASVKVVYRLQ